jgi:hypothetical protein
VAGDLGVGRGFTEGGDKESGPAVHGQGRHFPAGGLSCAGCGG